MDHLCYLCCVFVMLSRLFIAALWSPADKGLTSWLLFVMFVFLSLSHVVSWFRCSTRLYRFLIFADFHTCIVAAYDIRCQKLHIPFIPLISVSVHEIFHHRPVMTH